MKTVATAVGVLGLGVCWHAPGAELRLIPQPQQVTQGAGRFDWAQPSRVCLAVPGRSDDAFAASQLRAEVGAVFAAAARLAESGTTGQPVHLGLLADAPIAGQLQGQDLDAVRKAGPDAYLLVVEPQRIIAAGNGLSGTFYAVQTLKQLIRANRDGTAIPCVRILDWPGLRYRGYLDDISRGPIPTMDFFRRQIRTMAEFKMNLLTFYTEHVFKLEKHPLLAPADGLTAAEVRELSAFARQHHVELVGCFQSFGHFGNILCHKEYADLRETGGIITPAKEESYRFLDEVYSEIAPAYESKLFNVCCDETYGLGEGPSKPLVEKIGVGGVYVQHVNRLHDLLRDKYGKRMLMWGDIALQHPTIVQQLAKDTLLLSWGYGAAPNYDAAIAPFVKAGFEFLVCPGVSCWSQIFPHYENAVVNIQNYVRDGARHGALGLLNTTWDDDGENLFHWNFYGTNWGAACAWRPPDSDLEAFNSAYASVSYGVPDDRIARAIRGLAACARNPLTQQNADSAFWVRPFRALATSIGAMTTQSAALAAEAEAATRLLEQAKTEVTVDFEDLDYLLFAGHRLGFIGQARQRHLESAQAYGAAVAAFPDTQAVPAALEGACARAEATVGALAGLRAEYERLWRLENRASGLDRVLARYDALLADLRAHAKGLADARAEFARTGVPPDPTALGLAIVETSRRRVEATPTAEALLPVELGWWDPRWSHRVALRVETGEAELVDYPVEVRLNLGPDAVDPASFRVVECTPGAPAVTPLLTQFDPAATGNAGNVVFVMPGKTAPKASRLFAVYFGLAGTPPKPAQSQAGVTATAEAGGVWVENQRLRAWIGPHGAHVFEWYVKAIPGLEITEPGRGGWAGFADSMGDRGAPFEIVIEAAGPVLVRLRASSVATGTEKVFAFYADRACVEVMLSNPVGYYWDFDRVENYASDKGSPGTALFANGHREPVCGSTEQVHAMGHGVYWGAKFRGDGLLLANITPEVQALHMTGPGAGWGGVGIEGGAQAAHFVTFADQVTADPASVLNELRQTLDLRSQPKVWLAKPVLAPAAVPAR